MNRITLPVSRMQPVIENVSAIKRPRAGESYDKSNRSGIRRVL